MTSEIRANKQTNRAGLGTVTYADTGIIVSGIVTCTELSGLTALNIAGVGTASTLDINGDIDVDGHTNLDNVSITGIVTATGNVNVASGDIIFSHSNHNLRCASSASTLNIQGGASNPGGKIELRGGTSDNDIRFLTSDGSGNSVEKFRIHHNGNIGVNSTSPTSKFCLLYTSPSPRDRG